MFRQKVSKQGLVDLVYFCKLSTGSKAPTFQGHNCSLKILFCNYSTATNVAHPFFRHNEKQTKVPVTGKIVQGKIPSWLEGTLIRNGPGIQKVGNYTYNHLFDGLAILHKFTIKNGEAFYQSRALESEAYEKNFAAKRIVVNEFGTTSYPDPCQSIFGRLQSKFTATFGKNTTGMEMTDNCSVNVGYYGDQLYAMTETVFIRRVDPETLKCIGDKTRIKNYCALNTATAHPHCLEDGSMINAGNNFRDKRGPQYCFVKVPPSFGSDETAYKDAKMIGEIPSRWKFNPGYFHSFGMTSDKIIFIEMPLTLDLLSIVPAPLFNNTYLDCLKWYPKEKSRFHIISMEDGKPHPVTYETDNLFIFHHINAYEENGFLIVDVAGYNDADFVKNATVDISNKQMELVQGATARRYILPLNIQGAKPGENLVEISNTTATAILRKSNSTIVDLTPHHLTNDWFELPRINYKYNGKKYNFIYGLRGSDEINPAVPHANKITKIDIENGTMTDFSTGEAMASEPIFVANPTKSNPDEDDGVVLSSILHKLDPQDVSLLILNAKDMKEISRIQFRAEGEVTSTFHGLWTPSQQSERINGNV